MKMRIQYIMAGALTVFLLTGCGSKDVVLQQAKEQKAEFVSSIYDFKQDEGTEKQPAVTVLEERCKQIAQLKEIVKKNRESVVGYSSDEEEDGEEYEELLATDWNKLEEVKDLFCSNGLDGGVKGENYIYALGGYWGDREKMLSFIRELEAAGYSDLSSLFETMEKELKEDKKNGGYYELTIVRNGVQFMMSVIPSQTIQKEEYDVDIQIPQEGQYGLDIQIPLALLVTPVEYADFMQSQVMDGFYPVSFRAGGFMDCLTLVSSWDEPGNPYNKAINFYLKDGKPIQLEVKAMKNKREGSLLFSGREQETVAGLLAALTGDASASKAFATGMEIGKEKSGTIGKCQWTLETKGILGNRSYTLLVQ